MSELEDKTKEELIQELEVWRSNAQMWYEKAKKVEEKFNNLMNILKSSIKIIE
jgi:hypothetical protein